jgi:cell division protein FtsN
MAWAQAPDAVFLRARQLTVGGNPAAGRALLDSVIAATPPDTPAFSEGVYWRAALAADPAAAERDYRRLIVEYPLSARAADALYALAQLEEARGDRANAARHLGQFLTDNPGRVERPRATLLYLRLLTEQNALARGCPVLRQTLADVPDTEVETRNQLEYYLPQCAVAEAAPAPTQPERATPAPPTTSASGKAAPTVAPAPRFTLQVAAYKTRAEADALVKRLAGRGIEGRVTPANKLYRVRIGHYATRANAVAAQRELRAKKIETFVTDHEPPTK